MRTLSWRRQCLIDLSFMYIRIFETERLICRRWIASDFETLFEVYSDAEAMRWVGDGEPISREQCAQWFRVTEANYVKRGYGMFTVESRATGKVIGFCGLVHQGGQVEAEIKYAYLRSCWGQGIATEAVFAMLAYGLEVHGLLRIIATVDPDNLASQGVLLKAGMVLAHIRAEEDGTRTNVYEWLGPQSV